MAEAHGADDRLHDVRGERSNVPREARYYTEWGRYNLGKNEDEMKLIWKNYG